MHSSATLRGVIISPAPASGSLFVHADQLAAIGRSTCRRPPSRCSARFFKADEFRYHATTAPPKRRSPAISRPLLRLSSLYAIAMIMRLYSPLQTKYFMTIGAALSRDGFFSEALYTFGEFRHFAAGSDGGQKFRQRRVSSFASTSRGAP